MAWYNGGTVTVTNGSTVVTGAGTDFVNNVSARDSFALVSVGTPNEIASVDSKTQLTLARPWVGASANAVAYFIQPTVGIYVDLALRALNMLTPFQAVLDGIGQGMIAGGTVAAPGLRFLADQDTGIHRPGEDQIALVTGGVARAVVTKRGLEVPVLYGRFISTVESAQLGGFFRDTDVASVGPAGAYLSFGARIGDVRTEACQIYAQLDSANAGQMAFITRTGSGLTEKARFTSDGSFLVGVTNGTYHTIAKAVASNAGNIVLDVLGQNEVSARFFAVAGGGLGSSANAAFKMNKDASTGRSANAPGTINAAGADYAEYMTKALGCGLVAKGDVCGVDQHGQITRTWADAILFKIKSTDPNLVGGDNWAAHLGDRPEMPIYSRATTKAAYAAAVTQYETDLAVFEAALETARQLVDRIAYCGRVPVNFADPCQPGDYLVAIANGGGIGMKAVAEADVTFADYRRRVGRVLSIGADGRPIVDVMQG